jgi:hypothetical protein
VGRGSRRWTVTLLALVAVAFGVRYEQPRPAAAARFLVTVGAFWPEDTPAHWLRVASTADPSARSPLDTMDAPAGTGKAAEVVSGPGGMFVLVAAKSDGCGSRIFQFWVSSDGQVQRFASLAGSSVPAEVAGMAVSPDGHRLAYAAMPCTGGGTALVVLQLKTGSTRTWTAPDDPLLGEIVWAEDNRTLGYTATDQALTGVVLTALDTHAEGTDLRAGRVLLDARTSDGRIGPAWMNADGRTGFAVRQTDEGTDDLALTVGRPPRVTRHTPRDPEVLTMTAYAVDGPRRFACLNGLDAFGRITGMQFTTPTNRCDTAYTR